MDNSSQQATLQAMQAMQATLEKLVSTVAKLEARQNEAEQRLVAWSTPSGVTARPVSGRPGH